MVQKINVSKRSGDILFKADFNSSNEKNHNSNTKKPHFFQRRSPVREKRFEPRSRIFFLYTNNLFLLSNREIQESLESSREKFEVHEEDEREHSSTPRRRIFSRQREKKEKDFSPNKWEQIWDKTRGQREKKEKDFIPNKWEESQFDHQEVNFFSCTLTSFVPQEGRRFLSVNL